MKKSRQVEKQSNHRPQGQNQGLDQAAGKFQKEFLQQQAEKRKGAWKDDRVRMAYAILKWESKLAMLCPCCWLADTITAMARLRHYGSRGLSLASNLWQIRRLQNQRKNKVAEMAYQRIRVRRT